MLTDAKVKTLKPKDKVYRILDGERLYIEVRPTGTKIWRFKFTLHGKEGTLSFGEYPAVSLAAARKMKDDAKALLAQDLNPSLEKKKEQLEKRIHSNSTFKSLTLEYIQEKMKYKSESYVDRFKTSMEKDVFKEIGSMPVSEITSAHVLQVMQNTQNRVKNQPRYGTGEAAANLTRRFIGLVMRYAIMTSRATIDPTYALKGAIEAPEVEHARPLQKHEKSELIKQIAKYNGTTTVKNAALTMLYSMLRTIEIRRMEWKFVDFDHLVITFPKASRKLQQERTMKMNRTHLVPITKQLHKLLLNQYQITGDQRYVFASPQKRDCMISRTTLNRALEYMGLQGVTAHDFRATASTELYEHGYEEDWIEKQLAHAESNKTKASYDHSRHLEARRKMLQDWCDIVDGW